MFYTDNTFPTDIYTYIHIYVSDFLHINQRAMRTNDGSQRLGQMTNKPDVSLRSLSVAEFTCSSSFDFSSKKVYSRDEFEYILCTFH